MRLFEVLQIPNAEDLLILVLPFLRPFDNPPFDTIGESVDYFSQVFEVSIQRCACLSELICPLFRVCRTCTNTMLLTGEYPSVLVTDPYLLITIVIVGRPIS